MSEEKKGFEPLSKDALQDITGGVPYMKPEIFDLLGASITCASGYTCIHGLEYPCYIGALCYQGIARPE